MKLSNFFTENEIINEQDFEALGIVSSKTEKKICTFIDSEKYISEIGNNVSMLITTKEIFEKVKDKACGFYIAENPRIKFFEIHNELSENNEYKRKDFVTTFGENCKISKMSNISDKNVTIGNNVIIEEFVSIKENVTIGDNVIIRAGSVIGGTGFEFKRIENSMLPVKHIGGVKIDDNVEIQYNVTIDKAIYPWDDTIIGKNSKIDNLIHIAHGCKIGKNVMLPSGSTIGGRVIIDDDAWIGIGCIIRNGIRIGKNARCNMGAVVTKDVQDGESVSGNFAMDHNVFINNIKKWSIGE